MCQLNQKKKIIQSKINHLSRSPILLFAQYGHEEYYDGSLVPVCLTQAQSVWAFTFFLMTISVFFLLPLIILVILYAIIAKNLIRSDTKLKIRLSKPELSVKARKQVVLMLGAVVLSFFTCLLPFRVLTLYIIFVPEETFQSLNMETYYNLLYFCRIMWYLNSAVNPILYNLMSSKFRKGFVKLCRCCLIGRNSRAYMRGRTRKPTFNTTTTTSTYLAHSCCHHHHHCHHHEMVPSDSETVATKKTLSLDDLRRHAIVTHPKTNIPKIVTSTSASNLHKTNNNKANKKAYHATSCVCTCACSSENYDEQVKRKATTTTTPTHDNLRKLAFKNSSARNRNVSFDETTIFANNQRNFKMQYKKQISLDERLLRKKIINNGLETGKYGQFVVKYIDEATGTTKTVKNEDMPQNMVPLLNGGV